MPFLSVSKTSEVPKKAITKKSKTPSETSSSTWLTSPIQRDSTSQGFSVTSGQKSEKETGDQKHIFLDDDEWVILARKHGVRLPRTDTPLDTGKMKRWLTKLGVSNKEYLEWTGKQTREQFIKANPHWTLRAWAGVVLEWVDERT
jgi:hypothetical protein